MPVRSEAGTTTTITSRGFGCGFTGVETELDKVGGELGVLGRDTEVGAHRQTEARTHCRSLWRRTGLGLAGPRHDPYDSRATHVDRRNDGHGQTANGEEPVGHDHKTPTSGRETGVISRVSGKMWKRELNRL